MADDPYRSPQSGEAASVRRESFLWSLLAFLAVGGTALLAGLVFWFAPPGVVVGGALIFWRQGRRRLAIATAGLLFPPSLVLILPAIAAQAFYERFIARAPTPEEALEREYRAGRISLGELLRTGRERRGP
jgi:hypothetical protein